MSPMNAWTLRAALTLMVVATCVGAPASAQPASTEVCPGLDWAACSAAAAKAFEAKDYAGALPMYAASCAKGRVGAACSGWGWIVNRGEGGVAADPVAAARIWDDGCNLGFVRCCVQEADLLLAGRGGPADPKRAFELNVKACQGNDGYGCYHLGVAHHRAAPPNFIEARTHYLRACALNHADGCHEAARLLEAGSGGPVDLIRAYQNFIQAEQLGRSKSVADAVRLWLGGKIQFPAGTGEKAVTELLERACKIEDWASCTQLASRLDAAPDRHRHVERIRALATSACDHGFGPGCGALGWHLDGIEVAPIGRASNVRAAIVAYERGCQLGDVSSCARLGELLLDEGQPNEAERVRALALLERGCEVDRFEFACVAKVEFTADAKARPAALGRLCDAKMGMACLVLAEDLAEDQAASKVRGPAADKALFDAFLKACDLSQGQGCTRAAELVSRVEKAPAVPEKRRELLARACGLVIDFSCWQLGVMMYAGEGGPVDVSGGDAATARFCAARPTDGCSYWCSTHPTQPVCALYAR